MIPKNKSVTVKGMAFAGCSFTWGQSLWYYSNLPSLVVQDYNKYDPNYVSVTHRACTEANRYPRLVAKHFNTYELCQPFNGGSNSTILDYWQKYALRNDGALEEKRITNRNIRGPVYDINDISHFTLQLTHWARTDINLVHRGVDYGHMQRWVLFQDKQDLLEEYLEDKEISIERFFEDSKKEDVTIIRNFLLDLERQGLQVSLLCWPQDLVEYIKKDSWLYSHFVKLYHDGKEFESIFDLIDQYPTMAISGDTDFFTVPPKDDHPSIKCHRVIADSIIRHIEKRT